MRTFPSSTSIMMATPVNGLVMDMIWKIESVRIGFFSSIFCQPTACRERIAPLAATSVTAPEICPLSTNSFMRTGMRARAGGRRHGLLGFGFGRENREREEE